MGQNDHNQLVLLTGATGMLGSCLAAKLLETGFNVRAIYRNPDRIKQYQQNIQYYYPEGPVFRGKLQWVEADLLDCASLSDALDGIDMVYHTAAMVSFDPSQREAMLENNITGTANLVNAILDHGPVRLVHVSSIGALGPSDGKNPVDENCHWRAGKKNSGYSISKFHSEMEVWRGIEEGLEAIIVNPSVILGPGDWRSGSPSFFSTIYKKLKFYPGGSTGFVDVRDVVDAMLLLSAKGNFKSASGNRYLLNGANLSYQDLFSMLAQALVVAPPSIAANSLLLSLGWRFSWIWARLTGKAPLITRESVMAANRQTSYNGQRIEREFGFAYRPIEKTIGDIARMFLSTVGKP